MPIYISGTLEEVGPRLMAMHAVIQYHKMAGWNLFQSDENWDYATRKDNLVCPICQGLEGEYNGTDIPIDFGAWQRQGQNIVYPNTHESVKGIVSYLRGDCRCSLTWDDYLFVLCERLFEEMEEKSS